MLLYIDKPAGITSYDVIRRLKEIGREVTKEMASNDQAGSAGYQKTSSYPALPKIGHAGTLDPPATGLLIVGIGPGTKELNSWLGQDKEYLTEVLLGVKTNTGDVSGEVEQEKDVPVTTEQVAAAVGRLEGTIDLPVPRFSAVKSKGQPLYKKARQGKAVDVPRREMIVREAELLGVEEKQGRTVIRVRLLVASGVYIRSLAEYLAEELKTVGTVSALRRTKIGEVDISQAIELNDPGLKEKLRPLIK